MMTVAGRKIRPCQAAMDQFQLDPDLSHAKTQKPPAATFDVAGHIMTLKHHEDSWTKLAESKEIPHWQR